MSVQRHPLILIAGPSGSGKSTLAKALAAHMGFPCLSLDDYYIPRAKVFVETANGVVRTFERPESYDGEKLAIRLSNRTTGTVAEGFCLFQYRQVRELGGVCFYIDAPFSVCSARRAARRPQRPSDRSFALVGEAETMAFVAPQKDMPGVLRLDGTASTADLMPLVLDRVGRSC